MGSTIGPITYNLSFLKFALGKQSTSTEVEEDNKSEEDDELKGNSVSNDSITQTNGLNRSDNMFMAVSIT